MPARICRTRAQYRYFVKPLIGLLSALQGVATVTAHLSRCFKSSLPRPSTEDVSLYDTAHPSPGCHTVLAAPSGGSASTVSSRLTPSGQGAKFGQPRVTRHDRLCTHHPPFHLAQVFFIIFWGSGSGGTSREVRSAHTQATSSSTASSTIPLPRQLWSEGAPLFPHAARSLIGHLSRVSLSSSSSSFSGFPVEAGKSESLRDSSG